MCKPEIIKEQQKIMKLQIIKLSNDDTMSYSIVGPESGSSVISIGGLGHYRTLVFLFEEMANKYGLRLISFDRPLGGKSSPSRSNVSRLKQVAINAIELLEHLNVKQPISIMGQSCGSVFALEFARMFEVKHPDRLRGIVLIVPWT